MISNDETAHQFGDRIMEAPRAFARNSTSISAGIDFAMTQLDRAPYEARRRVIDILGDGDNNSGRDAAAARDEAVAKAPRQQRADYCVAVASRGGTVPCDDLAATADALWL